MIELATEPGSFNYWFVPLIFETGESMRTLSCLEFLDIELFAAFIELFLDICVYIIKLLFNDDVRLLAFEPSSIEFFLE